MSFSAREGLKSNSKFETLHKCCLQPIHRKKAHLTKYPFNELFPNNSLYSKHLRMKDKIFDATLSANGTKLSFSKTRQSINKDKIPHKLMTETQSNALTSEV